MKKKILLFITLALVIFSVFVITASAETVISENNIAENGDIVADVIKHVSGYQYYLSVDINYLDTEGNTKNGKFYYLTGTGLYRSRIELFKMYIPADFDLNQTVYFFDKVDLDADGEYDNHELLGGTSGNTSTSRFYTYTSFDEATCTFGNEPVDAKLLVQSLSYSKYLTYFGSTFLNLSPVFKTMTYNGKEAVDGTLFISPSITEIMANTFGGNGNGSVNSVNAQYRRIVFEAREGTVSFGQYCFCRAQVEQLVFLDGTYSLRNDAFAFLWEPGTNTPSLENVVITPNTSVTGGPLNWNVGSYDIVFIGTEEEYTTANGQDKYSALSNASGSVIYEELCYVCGHVAEEDDNDCTTASLCKYCDLVMEEAHATHDIIKEAEYANGYLSSGTLRVGCARCEYGAVDVLEPLFIFRGYSVEEANGGGGVVVKYGVDHDAIAEYELEGDKEVRYGLFVAIKDKIGENNIIGEDGTIASGAIVAEVTSNKFSFLQIKVTGIDADKQETKLALGVFAIIQDTNGKEISYVQDGTPVSGEKYCFISYKDLKN